MRRPTGESGVGSGLRWASARRYTAKQIAAEVGVSPAAVSRILRRFGLNKLSALEPAEPIRRYERDHPGELIHLDIRKPGASALSGIASPDDLLASSIVTMASVGNTSTSALTTPRASLSCRSCLTNAKRALSPS